MANENTTTIEERLTKIESSLNKITDSLNLAPNLMSIAADSVDEVIQQNYDKGVNVEDRFKNGVALLGRLSDPKINTTLNGLIDLIEQAPGLVSMVADSVDEDVKNLNRGSVKIDDRVKAIQSLSLKLSHPDNITKIDNLLTLSDQLPGLVAMTVDSVDSLMERYGDSVKDSLSFLKTENLLFLKSAGEALSEAHNETPAKVGGIFSILRALKDPGRQKALGFLMNVLKNLGNKI